MFSMLNTGNIDLYKRAQQLNAKQANNLIAVTHGEPLVVDHSKDLVDFSDD